MLETVGLGQEPEIPPGLPTWVAGTQIVESFLAASQVRYQGA